MMAGVMHSEIIGVNDAGVGWTCPSQGKGAPGGSVGSGDRTAVSICVILATTSSGAVMRRPVVSSRITERFVGRKRGIGYPFRCAHNRFERNTRFLNKKAEQGLTVSHAMNVAGMADESPRHFPQTFKAGIELGW